MKFLLAGLSLILLLAASTEQQAAKPYFRYTRDISISAPTVQNYVVVDDDLWQHARADLADVRIYNDENQVPYVLQEQRSRMSKEEKQVRILNLGMAGNHVQFDVDLGDIPEYDRLRLQLDAKNFVATAQVEGRVSLQDEHGVKLGHFTLYDFTGEKLGSNSILQLPASSFRFLHVSLGGGLHADQIKTVFVSNVEDKKAIWRNEGNCEVSGTQQNATTFICSKPDSVPIDRISVQIDASKVNFRRFITVVDSSGAEVAQGEIERIKMDRQGQSIVSENLALDISELKGKEFKVVIQNGDDAPLPVEKVQPLSIERRVYFDPQGKSVLKLYCGDEKLESPDYDYAKFFHEDQAAVEAQLGPTEKNASYTGRPDDRPWSEQHKVVMWLAMIFAVGLLALLAVRGFKADAKSV